MINKVHLAVMTADGLKEAEIFKNVEDGFIFIEDELVHYCPDSVSVLEYFLPFLTSIQDMPRYENK